MKKRLTAVLLLFVLAAASVFAACGKKEEAERPDPVQQEGPAAGDVKDEEPQAPPEDTAEMPGGEGGPEASQDGPGDIEISEEPGEMSPQEEMPEMEGGPEPGSNYGVLVVYFSMAGEQYNVGNIEKGNTAVVAEMIAEETGADLCELKPLADYPASYEDLKDAAQKEKEENARPGYQDTVPDLSRYSTIFIGAPVWWEDWPMIMYTFFENEDLTGKILLPFCTYGGSGLCGLDEKLAQICTDSMVAEGLAILGEDAQNNQEEVLGAVRHWLSELGY